MTDAQFHLYAASTPERPWPNEGRTSPPAKHVRSFTAEEMLGAMKVIGVDRAVITPPAWAGEEHNNAHALTSAANYPSHFAVMGRIDPYDPASPELLEHWLDTPHVIGIRMSGRWNTTARRYTRPSRTPRSSGTGPRASASGSR